MLIGTMNHPQRNVLDEISRMAGMGMGFLDLTLEPPNAASWNAKPGVIRAALERLPARSPKFGPPPFTNYAASTALPKPGPAG